MTNPAMAMADALQGLTPEQVKAALTAPNMRDKLLPNRAIGGAMHTVDEAMKLAEGMAAALDRSAKLPIRAVATRETDGSMTIRVTPAT